jgi:MFS family permease
VKANPKEIFFYPDAQYISHGNVRYKVVKVNPITLVKFANLKIIAIVSKLGVTVYMIFQVLSNARLYGLLSKNWNVKTCFYLKAISPSFWGALSDVWGRRPVYLSTMLVYVGACIGLAMNDKYWVLLVLRMIQAFGSSSVVAIGAGTICKYIRHFA